MGDYRQQQELEEEELYELEQLAYARIDEQTDQESNDESEDTPINRR